MTRHVSKGAWPFSTRDHGWPISDCTSEGLKAELMIREHYPALSRIEDDTRLFDAVNVILSLQNDGGGQPETKRLVFFFVLLSL